MSIAKHYNAARNLAMKKLIAAARKILKEHPHLDEFVCAMGTCEFTVRSKKGDGISDKDYIDPSDRAYMRPVARLIDEWNDRMGLTGEGIRFTASGKVVRRW